MKHNETNLGEKRENREENFHCIYCDYKCSVRFSYERHLLSSKHLKQVEMKQNETNETKKEKKEKSNSCGCGLVCNSRTTLWRHKKTCISKSDNDQNADKKEELLNYLIKENQEFKNLILEIVQKDTTINNNSNNITNSNNKAFNLNFFLNEQCKDAMNMTEFVDSIKLQYSDLENVGRLGFVNGISDIIIKSLKALDIHRRPVHCADLKREIMYVKDENQWKKEEDNTKIRRAIKCIAQKNSKNLVLFKQKYPDCLQGDSKSSDRYNKLMVEAFGGGKADDATNEDKIIRRISKEVTIDKSG
jgi:hypothetical protein